MGLIEFLILVFVVVVICAVAVSFLGKVPNCPAWVAQLVWFVGAAIIIYTLLQATGILQHDPQIPRLR